MEDTGVRYGASYPLNITSDDDDAVTAKLYIGKPGETAVITKTATFVANEADLSLTQTDTRHPLGDYKLQINVEYANGDVKKFPDPQLCGDDFPTFTIYEALDETEVT